MNVRMMEKKKGAGITLLLYVTPSGSLLLLYYQPVTAILLFVCCGINTLILLHLHLVVTLPMGSKIITLPPLFCIILLPSVLNSITSHWVHLTSSGIYNNV